MSKSEILMTKKTFAEWIGVSQQAVSGYIRNEQISRRAIMGEHRYAKIAVNLAIADLRERLDATGSQTLNVRANLRFYRRSSATTGLSKEEEAQCVAQIVEALQKTGTL